MDFDARLETLLDEHGLRPARPGHTRIEQAVVRLWRDLPHDRRIVLYGEAEDTAELSHVVGGGERRIVAVVTDLQDLGALAFDVIVVSSFRQRVQMAADARRRFPACEVLDLYDALAARGGFEGHRGVPFYACSEYVKLFERRRAYETAGDAVARAHALRDLTATYFEIRDFVNGFRYAEDYVAGGGEAAPRVTAFVVAARALLAELGATLHERGKDVALFLVDAIRMTDIRPDGGGPSAMPFLQSVAKDAMTFVRAFSPALYTLPAVPCMLTGRLPLDDGLYARRTMRVAESPLLTELSRRGYRLYNYVSWKDVFSGEPQVTPVKVTAPGDTRPRLSRAVTSRLLWHYACRLAADEGVPSCSLLHLFYETHDPHLCGHHRRRPVHHLFYEYLGDPDPGITAAEYREQFVECLAYLDAQLEFYFGLLPPDMVKVVFGDHGQVAERILDDPADLGPMLSWHDDRIRVALVVQAPRVAGFTYDGLFSMLDLGPLVLGAVDGTVSIPARESVPVQCDPIYNPRLREIFASVGCEPYLRGFKALRGARDKYVVYEDGAEEYYVLPDEMRNRIDERPLAGAVARMRSRLANRTFPDFSAREATASAERP
jgi:hypothetical protein